MKWTCTIFALTPSIVQAMSSAGVNFQIQVYPTRPLLGALFSCRFLVEDLAGCKSQFLKAGVVFIAVLQFNLLPCFALKEIL